jgi:tRNA A-37 threonylcarbamoyl transferase component Bud32
MQAAAAPRFDPTTGQPMQAAAAPRFDPTTGQPMQAVAAPDPAAAEKAQREAEARRQREQEAAEAKRAAEEKSQREAEARRQREQEAEVAKAKADHAERQKFVAELVDEKFTVAEAQRAIDKVGADKDAARSHIQIERQEEQERQAAAEQRRAFVADLVGEKFTTVEVEEAVRAIGRLDKAAVRSHITAAHQREEERLAAEAAAKAKSEADAAAKRALQQRRRAAEQVPAADLVGRRVEIDGKGAGEVLGPFKKGKIFGISTGSKHTVAFDDGRRETLKLRRKGNGGATFVLLDDARPAALGGDGGSAAAAPAPPAALSTNPGTSRSGALGAAAAAATALASELPVFGAIARVIKLFKGAYDAKLRADEGCAAMVVWAGEVDSVLRQLPAAALEGAGAAVVRQLEGVVAAMLETAEQRAAQKKLAQYAKSDACKQQQRAASAELARLLQLLQLSTAGSALQMQMKQLQMQVNQMVKIDGIAASLQKRTDADERKHERERAFGQLTIPRGAVNVRTGESEKLGEGGSAAVYKADYQGGVVAAKVISLKSMGEGERHQLFEMVRRELAVMAQLRSQRIIQVLGICEDPDASQIIMLMQLAEGGSLRGKLDGSAAPLAIADAVRTMHDAAIGMEFLHSKTMLHGDVKSLNMLLDRDGRVLVSDFGLSKHETNATVAVGSMMGSAPWMAPEAFGDEAYTKACDVFSFGVVMWEIMSRQVPWADKKLPQKISHAVCNMQNRPPLDAVHPSYPAPLLALMQECWAQDPVARPSFAVIVRKLAELG